MTIDRHILVGRDVYSRDDRKVGEVRGVTADAEFVIVARPLCEDLLVPDRTDSTRPAAGSRPGATRRTWTARRTRTRTTSRWTTAAGWRSSTGRWPRTA